MTNLEALQAQLQYPLKASAFQVALLNQSVTGSDQYSPENAENRKGVDLALADLILIMITAPKTISELDFSLGKEDADNLLALRSLISKKYGLPDGLEQQAPVIQDVTYLWGTTNYD